jgi:Major Facilitator Superfamily
VTSASLLLLSSPYASDTTKTIDDTKQQHEQQQREQQQHEQQQHEQQQHEQEQQHEQQEQRQQQFQQQHEQQQQQHEQQQQRQQQFQQQQHQQQHGDDHRPVLTKGGPGRTTPKAATAVTTKDARGPLLLDGVTTGGSDHQQLAMDHLFVTNDDDEVEDEDEVKITNEDSNANGVTAHPTAATATGVVVTAPRTITNHGPDDDDDNTRIVIHHPPTGTYHPYDDVEENRYHPPPGTHHQHYDMTASTTAATTPTKNTSMSSLLVRKATTTTGTGGAGASITPGVPAGPSSTNGVKQFFPRTTTDTATTPGATRNEQRFQKQQQQQQNTTATTTTTADNFHTIPKYDESSSRRGNRSVAVAARYDALLSGSGGNDIIHVNGNGGTSTNGNHHPRSQRRSRKRMFSSLFSMASFSNITDSSHTTGSNNCKPRRRSTTANGNSSCGKRKHGTNGGNCSSSIPNNDSPPLEEQHEHQRTGVRYKNIHETAHAQSLLLGIAFLFVWTPSNMMAPNLTDIATDFNFYTEYERDVYMGSYCSIASNVLSVPLSAIIGMSTDIQLINNRKWCFIVTCLLSGIVTILTAYCTQYWQFLLCRLVTGGCSSGTVPIVFSLLSDLFDVTERNAASSGLTAMMGLGIISGQVYAGMVNNNNNDNDSTNDDHTITTTIGNSSHHRHFINDDSYLPNWIQLFILHMKKLWSSYSSSETAYSSTSSTSSNHVMMINYTIPSDFSSIDLQPTGTDSSTPFGPFDSSAEEENDDVQWFSYPTGWAHAFVVSGWLTILVSLLCIWLVKEPERGGKEKALQDMIKTGAKYERKLTWDKFYTNLLCLYHCTLCLFIIDYESFKKSLVCEFCCSGLNSLVRFAIMTVTSLQSRMSRLTGSNMSANMSLIAINQKPRLKLEKNHVGKMTT